LLRSKAVLLHCDLTEQQVKALYEDAALPVRFRVNGGLASVPACTLIDAGLTTDLAMVHDSTSSTTPSYRSLQIRPVLSPNYGGCRPASHYSKVPEAQRLRKLTIYASTPVKPSAVQPLPAVVTGKGLNFQGQAEISEKEAVLHQGGLDPVQKAKLEEEMKKEAAAKAEAEKSFIQKYWHLLLPLGIIFVMNSMGGGGGGSSSQQEEGGPAAAAGRPAAGGNGGGGGRSR
jgi:hypothetical protein